MPTKMVTNAISQLLVKSVKKLPKIVSEQHLNEVQSTIISTLYLY